MSTEIKLLENVNVFNIFKSKTYFTAISLCVEGVEDLVEFSVKLTFNRSIKDPSDASIAADKVRDMLNVKGKLENFEKDMIAVRFFESNPSTGKPVDGYSVKKSGFMAEISQFTATVSREKLDSLKPLSL